MTSQQIEDPDSTSTASNADGSYGPTAADARRGGARDADALPPGWGDFGSALAQCAVSWSQQLDEIDMLQAITSDAQHLLPNADASAIVSLCRPERTKVHAVSGLAWMVTSALPHLLNHPDWQRGGSPRSIRLSQPGPTAASSGQITGIGSIICTPLGWPGNVFGTLLLLSATDAFDQRSSDEAADLAVHAALALTAVRERGHFHQAIQSRDILGQAKGILMEREHLTAEQAFEWLKWVSQNYNIKLHDVAEALCRASELGTLTPRRRKPRGDTLHQQRLPDDRS